MQKGFIFSLFKSTYNIVPSTPQFAVSKGHTLYKTDIYHLDNDTFSFQSARGVRVRMKCVYLFTSFRLKTYITFIFQALLECLPSMTNYNLLERVSTVC